MEEKAELIRILISANVRIAICGLLLHAAPSVVIAAECSSDDIFLGSQAAVDSFQADYGGGAICDETPGTLRIDGEDIENVDALSDLTLIGGHLHIQENPVLATLHGLRNIHTIGGFLRIADNASMQSLDGLSELASLGVVCEGHGALCPSLEVSNNAMLSNISGLISITSTAGDVEIWGNPSLQNLDGLSGITQIGGLLEIRDNAALTNIDGLSSLTAVGETEGFSLGIHDNPVLENLDGLANLVQVASLEIEANKVLANIDGLQNLTDAGEWISISHNDALENVDGLSAVRSSNDLWIQYNSSLADCQGIVKLIDPIDDYAPGPGPGESGIPDVGYANVLNNQFGCNSINEILGDAKLESINAGLNDAWYNADTAGQGLFVTVYPDLGTIFIAMFTYDTERPPSEVSAILGEPGHRWFTAYGGYDENVAVLDAELTVGGVFDSASPQPVQTPNYGTVTLEFTECNHLSLNYDFPQLALTGEIPMTRIALDNIPNCYVLGREAPIEQVINLGKFGAR